jgi:hypothetical protein
MRILVALLFSALAFPAVGAFDGAFDGAAVSEIYYEIRLACRQGETVKGEALTPKESDKQCRILDALGEQLKAHGYCWNKSEQEWAVCD